MSTGIATLQQRAADEHRLQTSLERALTCAFWQAMQREPMPVMAALEAAARTVGSLYRQVAAAHGPSPSCGCGWQPDPEADLVVLEAMLASALLKAREDDLASMTVAGRA